MFTLKLLLKRSCWTFIFMALALPASARVCFLPDSTDCGEGDVDVPEVQVTCATYGGYEAPEACLADLKDKTAQTCTLNSGCYYPKCAYDSERNCKRENPDKKCLSQDVDGVKCWYAQAKTCTEMGYKTACDSNEYNSTEVKDKNGNVIIDINNKTCYKCTAKKECKQMKPGVYYGPNDTCPQYRPDRKEVDNVKGSDGQCSTCDYQTCSYYGYQTSCAANQSATEKLTKDQASDGPCYTCEDKPVDKNCKIKGGCIIDMASIGHNSGHGTIGTGDNTEITYTCYITKAENATEADLQKIYGIMYSDFNCQSSMGQIMSSGYQRVGGVINLSSSPVSGKFTVGELTRLANCQGNTAEYNWDTKIELYNGTDHCNFTEEIFTKTCKQLGYINKNNNCSSNNLVKTLVENVIGTDGQCYTCKKAQTCSKISNGTWKGEKDKNTCPTGYKPEVVESTVGATVFSDGPCYKCEEKVTITIALDATNTTVNFSSFSSDNKGYTVKLSLNGGGNDGITYPVTVTEGRTATYFSSTYEPGDCDVHGDNCDNDLGNGRETVSAASNLSVIINDQTVLNNLTTENEYLDMRYFIGKTYDTDNYIIKFVKVQTCSDIGYQTTPCSTGYKQIDYIQLPHEDCYTCSKCYRESSEGEIENNSTIYYFPEDEPYKQGECASEMTINVACNRVIPSYKPGGNYHEYRKLYINGKESIYPALEAQWHGYFMDCNGCARVTCTFKYGDKKTITIINVGGEEERE